MTIIIMYLILDIAVDCGNLVSPVNGAIYLSGLTYLSKATYTCNTGYQLRGPVERTCDTDGLWSQYSPSCNREYTL